MTTTIPITKTNKSAAALRWSLNALVATVWASACIFGLYILTFYIGALFENDMTRWNTVLPELYQADEPVATSGIGVHFAAGGIILILGSIQLMQSVRTRFPRFHRWTGRLYVVACLLAAIGGLTFIALNGTVGGVIMDVGFGLYGLLMLLAAVKTIRHARGGRMVSHNHWAWRLYALAVGSWLYRMDYGFWLLLTDGLWSTPEFSGPFDHVMAFFFYIPNLLLVEVIIRAKRQASAPAIRVLMTVVLLFTTAFLLLGTYFFTTFLWGPVIVAWFS